jgi:hypothetical protein
MLKARTDVLFVDVHETSTKLLSRGNTEDPAAMYRAWLGREPSITPMLKERLLMVSATSTHGE